MVFSNEVCSTYTAISSQTLLSDHVYLHREEFCVALYVLHILWTFIMGRISAWPKYLVVYDSIASLISVSSRCSSVSHKSELYEGCSKSIRDFFPRKLMKHGRFAVVGRWRVPSCAYVDFFPPADNVSHVQPACEWGCIHSARWIVIFCVNVILWLKSSPFQLRFRVGDPLIIAGSHVRRAGCLSNHRNIVFGQENLNQLRH